RAELARALPGVEVRVTGERACRVWPAIDEISPAAQEAAARAELVRAFGGKEATFTLAETLNPVKVPLGEHRSTVQARLRASDAKSGTLGVPIEILVDGLRYRTVWSSWRVDLWETRPVLSRPVRAGEELKPELFSRARVQVGQDVAGEALDPQQVA